MPRPGTRVIPDGWSDHHRPTVEGTMPDKVQLRRPSSDKTFNTVTKHSEYPEPAVLVECVARLQRIARRGGDKLIGQRFVIVQMYQVSLPADIPEPQIDDQVYVVASRDDPHMVGKLMRIREVRLGSFIWERDVICEEVTPTTR